MELPKVLKVRQVLPTECIQDVPGEVRQALAGANLKGRVKPGSRVAITAGSRGISEIVTVLRTVVEEVKAAGAEPFIVPTMGSHGGAMAEGQIGVLAEYGITEQTMGCPIRSSMETVVLGTTPSGAHVHMDKNAYGADATIVVARVKAHTGFKAPIESGMCKMMTIGLGKHAGALSTHAHGLGETIPDYARTVIEKGNIVLGVPLVENAFHKLCRIEAVAPDRIHETDRRLLQLSNSHLPRVPFDHLHVLIVDTMGKNISGSGMDYNVIGIWRRIGGERQPWYERIVVLDVTPESEGNCVGMGMADFTTRRLFDKVDMHKTYTNVLTASNTIEGLLSGKIPIVMESDRKAVEAALNSVTLDGAPLRLVRIHSTLHLDEFHATEALLPEIEANPQLQVAGEATPMQFDPSGNFV